MLIDLLLPFTQSQSFSNLRLSVSKAPRKNRVKYKGERCRSSIYSHVSKHTFLALKRNYMNYKDENKTTISSPHPVHKYHRAFHRGTKRGHKLSLRYRTTFPINSIHNRAQSSKIPIEIATRCFACIFNRARNTGAARISNFCQPCNRYRASSASSLIFHRTPIVPLEPLQLPLMTNVPASVMFRLTLLAREGSTPWQSR